VDLINGSVLEQAGNWKIGFQAAGFIPISDAAGKSRVPGV
jgi:hypothetical protein